MNITADMKELLAAWNTIAAAAKAQFPKASAEELHRIIAGAMNHAVKVPS